MAAEEVAPGVPHVDIAGPELLADARKTTPCLYTILLSASMIPLKQNTAGRASLWVDAYPVFGTLDFSPNE